MMRPAINFFVFVFFVLAMPGVVFAMPLELVTKNLQDLKTTPIVKLPYPLKLPNTETFCSALAETKEKLGTAVASKEEHVSNYVNGLGQKLEDERNSRDAKLEEARSEADQKRSEWYARLEDRADGDDEEDAVVKYQQRVEEAVDDRRDAVDAAILDFRTAVDALAQKRKAGMQSARDSFKTSVEAATKKLETDCASGVTTDTLIKDFKAGLAIGRDKLAADKKSAAATAAEMKALAEARKKTIAAAAAAFQTELKAANEDLQTAFTGGE